MPGRAAAPSLAERTKGSIPRWRFVSTASGPGAPAPPGPERPSRSAGRRTAAPASRRPGRGRKEAEMSTAPHPGSSDAGPGSVAVFTRVLVGVDGTEPGFEACRQAAILAEPDAAIEAVCVVHLSDAIQVGLAAQRAADELQEEAVAALAEASRILGARAVTRSAERLRDHGDPARDRRARRDRCRDRLARAPARDRDPDRRRRRRAAPQRPLLGARRAAGAGPGRIPAFDRRRHRRLARVGCGVPRRRADRRALRRAAGDRRLESRQGRRRREGAPARAARTRDRRAPRGRARRGGRRGGPARRRQPRAARRQGARERLRTGRAPGRVLGARGPRRAAVLPGPLESPHAADPTELDLRSRATRLAASRRPRRQRGWRRTARTGRTGGGAPPTSGWR